MLDSLGFALDHLNDAEKQLQMARNERSTSPEQIEALMRSIKEIQEAVRIVVEHLRK